MIRTMRNLTMKARNAYGLLKTFGFTYTCPFCHWHARYFYPAGFDLPVLKEYGVISAGRRENIRCPRCKSSARERLIFLFLSRKSGVFSDPADVLHIAPEASLRRRFSKR